MSASSYCSVMISPQTTVTSSSPAQCLNAVATVTKILPARPVDNSESGSKWGWLFLCFQTSQLFLRASIKHKQKTDLEHKSVPSVFSFCRLFLLALLRSVQYRVLNTILFISGGRSNTESARCSSQSKHRKWKHVFPAEWTQTELHSERRRGEAILS